MRGRATALAALLLATSAGAQERAGAALEVNEFRYTRSIPAGDSGLVAVRLDAAALAHSSRSDLRLVTTDGRQVPYLLDRLDEPLVIALPVLARISTASAVERVRGRPGTGRSRYRVALPFADLPAGELVLRTGERVFDRRVSVAMEEPPVASDEPRRAGGEHVIASTEWRNANPDSAAQPLAFDLPPLPVSELVLTVDEGDNPPLPIAAPTLRLPGYRLRFFRDANTSLALLYGNHDLDAPRYDLALIAARLNDMPVHEVALGPEREQPHVARSTPIVVFWSALVIAVTLLLGLVVRLLRQGSSSANASSASSSRPPSAE